MGDQREGRINAPIRNRLRSALAAQGWLRVRSLRRLVAAMLLLLAVMLALHPGGTASAPTAMAVVATKDLPAGTAVAPGDVALRQVVRAALPNGVFTSVDAVVGQVLGGPARTGEMLTDVRMVGPANTRLATGDPSAAVVPIRLADPAVADLLRPGSRVDVITFDPEGNTTAVLATNATVITVRGEEHPTGQHGRLVAIALPHDVAAQVAAYSLKQPVTVTLR